MKHQYNIGNESISITLNFADDKSFLDFIHVQELSLRYAREKLARLQAIKTNGWKYSPDMNEVNTIRELQQAFGSSYTEAKELFVFKRQEYVKNNPYKYNPSLDKIENIKACRLHTGLDLWEAKKIVEDLMYAHV